MSMVFWGQPALLSLSTNCSILQPQNQLCHWLHPIIFHFVCSDQIPSGIKNISIHQSSVIVCSVMQARMIVSSNSAVYDQSVIPAWLIFQFLHFVKSIGMITLCPNMKLFCYNIFKDSSRYYGVPNHHLPRLYKLAVLLYSTFVRI